MKYKYIVLAALPLLFLAAGCNKKTQTTQDTTSPQATSTNTSMHATTTGSMDGDVENVEEGAQMKNGTYTHGSMIPN